ncbi:MAG: TIR domain-containing protein [Fimbriimonas sp.]|nr:TIR domain-containing protein [Fimbriimonas sp.]
MRKAFLSHSTIDKEYVRVIANRLGRSKLVFDEKTFAPGVDFRESILSGLDETALFVFFASSASLASTWCTYEFNEAQIRIIKQKIAKHLVIIIDRIITPADLPAWMQQAKIVVQPRPAQAARDVLHGLLSALDLSSARPFVGRSQATQHLVNQFAEVSPPHILVFSGLDGIGRRSILENFAPQNLGLPAGPAAILGESASLQDLYLWLLSETGDVESRKDMAAQIAAFAKLSAGNQVTECAQRIAILCDDGNLPMIIDQGSMLADDGTYLKEYSDFLKAFNSIPGDRYLALIHRRAPYLTPLSLATDVYSERVPPLDKNESRLLVIQLLKRVGANASNEQLSELVEAVDGFPPAAYFLASSVEHYGLSAVISDKSLLSDFKARSFSNFLKSIPLTSDHWLLLRYLSGEIAAPLSSLAIACNLGQEVLAPTLRYLVDHSLIVVLDDRYMIAAPIRDAVGRVGGFLGQQDYLAIADRLTGAFWQPDSVAPVIEVVDATLHAIARGTGQLDSFRDLVRPSLLHRFSVEAYRKKEWQLALQYGQRAQEMGLTRPDLAAVVFKSLVQLQKWDEAAHLLEQIKNRGDRQAPYLLAFMLRKQHRHVEAAKALRDAIESGDTSFSTYRDYADSLYRSGDLKQALNYIQKVRDRDPENVWVLDLYISISMDLGRHDVTEALLRDMERYDLDKRFIHHRRATYYASQRNFDLALSEAEAACNAGTAQLAAFATKADVLVELGRFAEARNVLEEIHQHFGSQARDVQQGLRCKLLLREGNWAAAKSAWDRMEDRSNRTAQALLLRIYEAKSKDNSLSLTAREDARKSADQLAAGLPGGIDPLVVPPDSMNAPE